MDKKIFNIENKKLRLRRLLFGAGLVLLSVLQNTDGLFPEIFGVRAMLLIPAVVCIAMFERETVGMFFGFFAGILWDMSSSSGGNFNALFLVFTCFVCGSLITYLMRNNLVTALLLSSVFTALHHLVYWLWAIIIKGNADRALSLFSFYIPSVIYTVIFLPIFYFAVRAGMKYLNDSATQQIN
ncbi:MAG: rod shape-determining protein MreD [Clostridiales bacterium]|nr:rod shape-determining protein MreD [Clostridiales bacterium]